MFLGAKVTYIVDHGVFIHIFANHMIFIHRSRSQVCRIDVHNCWFLESNSEVDVKKM